VNLKKSHRKGATMNPEHPDDSGSAMKVWLWKTALLACVLGVGTWLLLSILVPGKLPEDFPRLPDLQAQNALLRSLLSEADAAARSRPSSADDIGRLGMIYHSNQFYDQAASAYQVAARLASDDYRWPYLEALMQEENGRDQALCQLLQRTVRLKPDYRPALVKLGDLFFKQDKLDESERYYDLGVGETGRGSSPQAVFGLGRIAARRQDWKKVIQYTGPLSQEYPRIRPPHQLLADAYEALGQADRAAEERRYLLRPDLTVVPPMEDPLSQELLGLCCSSTRLLKQAGFLSRFSYSEEVLRLSRRAIEVEPNDADARHFLSIALFNVKGTDPKAVDEALAQLSEGLRLRPGDAHPLLLAAEIFFRHKKTDQAVEQMRFLLAKNAGSAEAHYFLGVAADRLGNANEAIAQYRDALKSNPNYAEPNYRLGLIFALEGKHDQAIGYFQKAVQIKPAFTRAHFNLAIALEQKGRITEAVGQYNKVLQLDNNDFEAHMNLGLIVGRSGRLEEATRHFREAVRLRPDEAQSHYALGYALAGQLKNEEAAEEFRQVLKLRPDHLEARQQLQQLERRQPR
jgi:tetratricopeptide (TPR) repeat protein